MMKFHRSNSFSRKSDIMCFKYKIKFSRFSRKFQKMKTTKISRFSRFRKFRKFSVSGPNSLKIKQNRKAILDEIDRFQRINTIRKHKSDANIHLRQAILILSIESFIFLSSKTENEEKIQNSSFEKGKKMCDGCESEVVGFGFELNSKFYHFQCFRCSKCKNQLHPKKIFKFNGKYLCSQCHER